MAGRLEPAEAARVCAEAARLLKQALAQEKDAHCPRQLAEGLAAVAGRLEPAEAARLLSQALAQEKEDDPVQLAKGLGGGGAWSWEAARVEAARLLTRRWPRRRIALPASCWPLAWRR